MTKGKVKQKSSEKRKKNSDSSELESKSSRVGGSPGGPEVSVPSKSVSELIKQSNDVLYNSNSCLNESVNNVDPDPVDTGSVPDPDLCDPDISVQSVFDSTDMENSKGGKGSGESSESGGGSSNSDIMAMLKTMNVKMEQIDKKLERLDSVEKKISNFESEVKKLWNFIHDGHKRLEARLINVEDRLESSDLAAGLMSDKISEMETAATKVKDDLLYLQSQSMRNNLLFSNITEDQNEAAELTEVKVRDFMVDHLQMAQDLVNQIKFERVHRIGRRGKSGAPRQIVAKFCYFKDRETVRKERRKLKGTNFYVSEQFPKEIVEKRRGLVPKMQEARKQDKEAWISYDTLFIDGQPVRDNSK